MTLTKRLAAALLATVLALAMLTACTGTLPPNGSDPDYDAQLILYRNEVLRLINALREEEKANGYDLAPLTLGSENLNAAAQKRATELATSFTHTRPDGTNWTSALNEYKVGAYGSCTERIAKGYENPNILINNADGMRFDDYARQALLSSQYSQIGIGYVEKDGQTYWVLLFVG